MPAHFLYSSRDKSLSFSDLTLEPEEHTILEPSCSGHCAKVAQLVEHTTENRSVGSSILPFGTKKKPRLERGFCIS